MEKKDQYHNPEEGQNNPRLEELAEKGAQGLLNPEEQKEYFALVKAQNTSSDTILSQDANIASLQNEKIVASDEQFAKVDALKMQLEDGIEVDEQYLQHAPEEFKELWEKSSPADQEVYKKHVEFTADGPNIIGKKGKKYELAKQNLSVADEDCKKGEINRYEGETYFQWDAMKAYTKKHNISVPTDAMYLDMLKVMPAGDVRRYNIWGVGGRQLFSILGGKLNGYLADDYDRHTSNGKGYLWTSACHSDFYAGVLLSHDVEGLLTGHRRYFQFPVRSLRAPK